MQRVIISLSLLGVISGLGALAVGFICAFIFAVLTHFIAKAKANIQMVALDISMFITAFTIVKRIDQELNFHGDLRDIYILVFVSVALLFYMKKWIKK